jgi:hypothetical protein
LADFFNNHPERIRVKDTVTVRGMMTSPRYVNALCRAYIEAAFTSAKIPRQDSQGVFYGQCMQRMLESAVEEEIDIAIVCDGDSLFTDQDILRLIETLEANDHIDAIASMQIRRGNKTMLASISGKSEIEISGDPFQVTTAHFGLTAIDLRKLRKVAKPWFISKSDENGEWGDARIDDDIWFWRQWEKAGNTVYMDPNTRIGHMEEMVVMVHPETYEAVHAYPNEWVDSCKSN